MGRKKKMEFKLNPEWMLKEPLDFEYNKYALLGYLQKCEQSLNNFEIYPDFVEISLHLANVQSLNKENTLLLTNKKFESCDDEILVKELIPKKPRELTEEEEKELNETIMFSGSRLFDAFNMAKAIWNIAYDSIDVQLKKNKKGLVSGSGYVFFYQKETETLFVWEYQIRKPKTDKQNNKTYLNLIYNGPVDELTMTSVLDTFSTWNSTEFYKELPIFELKCSQKFPMEETMIPIMKRKIMAYVFQIVNFEKISNNFDS